MYLTEPTSLEMSGYQAPKRGNGSLLEHTSRSTPNWDSPPGCAKVVARTNKSTSIAHPLASKYHAYGVTRRVMPGNNRRSLLAILLVGAVLCFAFETAGHWHRNSTNDEQCQVCHLAHSVSFGVTSSAPLLAPAPVTRLVLPAFVQFKFDLELQQVSPRAPPHASSLS